MKSILILIGLFILSGCSSVELTQQGGMVRQIQPDWATKCEFLGVVEGSYSIGWDVGEDRRASLNKIRNRVAERGGNAFVITDISSSASRTSIQADAYKCP